MFAVNGRVFQTIAALLALLATFLVAPGTWAAVGLNVAPPRFEVAVAPGTNFTEGITVENRGDEKTTVSVSLADVAVNAKGDVKIVRAGTEPRSAATWIRLNPTSFELEPEASQVVRFSFSMPADASGTYVALILFRTRPRLAPGDKRIAVAAEVGSTIVIDTQGRGTKRGSLQNLTASRYRPGEPIQVTVSFQNEGDTLLRPKGTWRIQRQGGAQVAEGKVNEEAVGVLPMHVRDFTQEWKGELAEGEYVLQTQVDYGERELLEGDRKFSVAKELAVRQFGPGEKAQSGSPLALSLVLENTGNLPSDAHVSVRVADTAGQVLETVEGQVDRIEVGKSYELHLRGSKPLAQGTYHVVADITYGASRRVSAEADIATE